MITEARFRIEYDWKKNYKQMWGLDKCKSTVTKTKTNCNEPLQQLWQWLEQKFQGFSKTEVQIIWLCQNGIYVWSFFATNLIKSKEKNGIFSSRSFTFPQHPLNDKRNHTY